MSSVAAKAASIQVKVAVWSAFWVALIAISIYWIVVGFMWRADHRYAGLSFGDANNEALSAMALRYGGEIAGTLRYGNPNVVDTHLNDVVFGTGQVRVFHFIGPRGATYCVPVQEGVSVSRSANAIVKGCSW